jgi:hypothetical protein
MITNTIAIEGKTNPLAYSLQEIVNSLSDDKIKEAINYLTYLKDKEEWDATMELSSPEILHEIEKGINEINSGKFSKFSEIRKNV